jgi:hypothetical protein
MGKLGRNSDVKGTKLTFLEDCREEFLEAQEKSSDAARKFYTKTARLWFLKYGYELDFGEDNKDCDEPDEHLANEMLDWTGLTEEEARHRKDIYDKTRTVCCVVLAIDRYLQNATAHWELVLASL